LYFHIFTQIPLFTYPNLVLTQFNPHQNILPIGLLYLTARVSHCSSSSSASPLPRDCAATDRHAAPPEACSSAAPRVTLELAHRLSSSLLALPEHATMPYHPPELPSLYRRRPPPLTIAAALPAPFSTLVASTRCLQAGHRSSSSPLVLFRALHAAPPLPERRPAAAMHRRPPAVAIARRAFS
jgi:hypothetical protein